MLKVRKFTVNNFEENTYLVIDADTNKAAVIDPGMLTATERNRFDEFISKEKIDIDQVILTHAHLDHCFGASYVRDEYGVRIQGHVDDEPLLKAVKNQAARFGMAGAMTSEPSLDVRLKDGDVIL
ncbi:MAG: MBL fold metallo-hydrolase, partial [Muribaculaceae bacterium]|nr:MBL fold metallo-hydrolase [Muribaculaceae bacterium]